MRSAETVQQYICSRHGVGIFASNLVERSKVRTESQSPFGFLDDDNGGSPRASRERHKTLSQHLLCFGASELLMFSTLTIGRPSNRARSFGDYLVLDN